MKILFVCLGNICRSPMAEGILQHIAREQFLNWHIESAGTESIHVGEPPHQYSQEVCLENHIDISTQRARQFVEEDLNKFDRIYALSTDVLHEIRRRVHQKIDENKVMLFLNELPGSAGLSVKDPWYGDKSGYYEVFEVIKGGCEAIAQKYSGTTKSEAHEKN